MEEVDATTGIGWEGDSSTRRKTVAMRSTAVHNRWRPNSPVDAVNGPAIKQRKSCRLRISATKGTATGQNPAEQARSNGCIPVSKDSPTSNQHERSRQMESDTKLIQESLMLYCAEKVSWSPPNSALDNVCQYSSLANRPRLGIISRHRHLPPLPPLVGFSSRASSFVHSRPRLHRHFFPQ